MAKRYYFKADASYKRGMNVNVSVYYIRKDGNFVYVGESDHNTTSWRGAKGHACSILNKKYGYKTDGYSIARKDVEIIQLP